MSTDENTDMDTPGDPRDPLAAWILDARADVERLTERTSEDDVHLGDKIRGKVIPRPLLERLSRRVLRAALLAALAGMALDAWRGWL